MATFTYPNTHIVEFFKAHKMSDPKNWLVALVSNEIEMLRLFPEPADFKERQNSIQSFVKDIIITPIVDGDSVKILLTLKVQINMNGSILLFKMTNKQLYHFSKTELKSVSKEWSEDFVTHAFMFLEEHYSAKTKHTYLSPFRLKMPTEILKDKIDYFERYRIEHFS